MEFYDRPCPHCGKYPNQREDTQPAQQHRGIPKEPTLLEAQQAVFVVGMQYASAIEAEKKAYARAKEAIRLFESKKANADKGDAE